MQKVRGHAVANLGWEDDCRYAGAHAWCMEVTIWPPIINAKKTVNYAGFNTNRNTSSATGDAEHRSRKPTGARPIARFKKRINR